MAQIPDELLDQCRPMNTEGHEGVAEAAGIPLLEEAFGKDNRSVRALYLGNWLTDVSQAVDPVAYASGSRKIAGGLDTAVDAVKKAVEGFLDELLPTLFEEREGPAGHVLRSLKPDLEPVAQRAKAEIRAALDFLVAAQVEDRDARLAKFFRDAFLVKGYYKFVHPEVSGAPRRMDFESFMRVFGRPTDTRGSSRTSPADDRAGAYTQYYPHEHLDRPEILPPKDPPIFAPGRQRAGVPFRVAYGKQPGTRSPRRRERIEPDLYSYLRDHIEMTAGLLAEVDLAFRDAIANEPRDDDPAWHLTLAKLGHALHQVEDFFAHSNWAELAGKRLGTDYLEKVLPPRLGVDLIDRASTTYRRRLKRYLTTPLPEWEKHEDEDWVVTGFFDFQDTVVSLLHLTEELWRGDVPDPYARGFEIVSTVREAIENPRAVEYRASRLVRDTLDFLTDPERALDDRENDVAQALDEKFGHDLTRLRRPGVSETVAREIAGQTTYLKEAPAEVQTAFFNVIIEGTRTITFARNVQSLYGAISTIVEFVRNPVLWLSQWASDELRQRVKDALTFYGREKFYDWLAVSRIGCHSLMAKDHGSEPFFEPAKECATAVHWYIVKTLLRWKETEPAPAYVDWLELLEYFLRNPLPPRPGSYRRIVVPVLLIHTVQRGEQLRSSDPRFSLEHRYRRTAIDPGTFTWRTIADANFATSELPVAEARDTINRILRDSVWGIAVTPPNYAFREGLRIVIPRQKAVAYVLLGDTGDTPWFAEVFDKGWKVFRGLEDPDTMMSLPALEHHRLAPISADDLDKIILRGKRLRREAREAYRWRPRGVAAP
jgi:hypothetical protein